jgi:hypothetical protein
MPVWNDESSGLRGPSHVIDELDEVVLTCDLPDHGLASGDIGTVVLVHDEGKGYEVEFMTLDGETIAVATLRAEQVRAVKHDEIAHARSIAS